MVLVGRSQCPRPWAVAAGCSNAKTTVTHAGNSAGVSSSRIVVGGVASLKARSPWCFARIFDGVNAYLDMVNAAGGVDGRKIDFAYPLDDGSSPSQDTDQVPSLSARTTSLPSLASARRLLPGRAIPANNVPTFGYTVSTQWAAGPSRSGLRVHISPSPAPVLSPPTSPNRSTPRRSAFLPTT